jgi:ribosomal protein S18 acetylase RimI-like enzyme
MKTPEIAVREIAPSDRQWVRSFLGAHFGSTTVVSRNVVHQADDLPGFIGIYRGEPSALLTYCVMNGELEVVSLHAAITGRGLGSRLLASARERARELRCRRLWLITTNDNEPAIGFYTRWGMHLAAVHRGAIAESRKLKPEISHFGVGGRPIEDEIEFELLLDQVHNGSA